MRSILGWRFVNGVALLGLCGWLGYDVLGKSVFGAAPWPGSLVDYAIIYEQSRRIVETGTYPPVHPYPPSAVLLHYAAAQFPYPVSAALWMVLTTSAAVGCCWALVRMLDLRRVRGWAVLVLLAYASASYFIQWDLRAQNCNLIFLAALLLALLGLYGGRPRAAGFWLALSVSLKLFSILLIPYLFWTGRRSAFAWTLAFLAAFWLLLPAAVLGVGGSWNVYGQWSERLWHAANSGADATHPILISLSRSAAWLAPGDPIGAKLIINAIRLLWLAVCSAAWARSRLHREARDDAFGLLADAGALTLAPIAVSPYLEPYHAVGFLIPALLLLYAAADGKQPARLRLLAAIIFGLSSLMEWVPAGWELRGLVVNLKLLVGVGGVSLIAWQRPVAPAGSAAGAVGVSRAA